MSSQDLRDDDDGVSRWRRGEAIVRREVWRGRAWMGTTVLVVEDSPALLATYLPEGAPFEFPPGSWPGGLHPWHGRPAWQGHGTLMLHPPGAAHAVWAFWAGAERDFAGWYVNLQAPFVRTAVGFDTLDHELDLVVAPDGRVERKDEELLEVRVREGRFTPAEVEAIRAEAAHREADLRAGRRWWDESWSTWTPPPAWHAAPLPSQWATVPAPPPVPSGHVGV
jgi:hypothetical protein